MRQFVTKELWLKGCGFDHCQVEEIPTAAPGVEWYAPGAEPWDNE